MLFQLLVEAGTVRSKVLLHLGHVKQYHAVRLVLATTFPKSEMSD